MKYALQDAVLAKFKRAKRSIELLLLELDMQELNTTASEVEESARTIEQAKQRYL